jgi:hypothetical protein
MMSLPASVFAEPVVIESRDCKRTITCDDEPTQRICREPVVIESRDKRTITCDDEPTSKRFAEDPLNRITTVSAPSLVMMSLPASVYLPRTVEHDCKRTIICDDDQQA